MKGTEPVGNQPIGGSRQEYAQPNLSSIEQGPREAKATLSQLSWVDCRKEGDRSSNLRRVDESDRKQQRQVQSQAKTLHPNRKQIDKNHQNRPEREGGPLPPHQGECFRAGGHGDGEKPESPYGQDLGGEGVAVGRAGSRGSPQDGGGLGAGHVRRILH